MAIAGGGVPSMLVSIGRNRQLQTGMITNVPESIVCFDMAIVADTLRNNGGWVRISPMAGNVPRLRDYLVKSGDIDE